MHNMARRRRSVLCRIVACRSFTATARNCDAPKAVEVEVNTERDGGDGSWSHTFTAVSSERAPEYDDCACDLTTEEEQAVIAGTEDDAINPELD
jgi:hypothetical protein